MIGIRLLQIYILLICWGSFPGIPEAVLHFDRSAGSAVSSIFPRSLISLLPVQFSSTSHRRKEQCQITGCATANINRDSFGLVTYPRLPSGIFSPLERVILSTNGNLQRLLSDYHGQPLELRILQNEIQTIGNQSAVYFRKIETFINNRFLYRCSARVHCLSETGSNLLSNGDGVGLGQLFHSLRVSPNLDIMRAGKSPNVHGPILDADVLYRNHKFQQLLFEDESNCETERTADGAAKLCLWREYALSCSDLKAFLQERFAPDLLEVHSR